MMVQIVVNDWMTSMGAIALMRLDPNNQYIQSDANRLEVPLDWIQNLPETLFNYFVSQYSVAEREYQALKNLAVGLEKRSNDAAKYKESKKWINDRVKGNVKKIVKYFPEMKNELSEIVEDLNLSIDSQDFKSINRQIVSLYEVFKRSEIDQKLTLNRVKHTILNSSGGQSSFLNVTKNALAFTEQMGIFERDYILPIIWENNLREQLHQRDEKKIEELFQLDEKPDYATKWEKEKKKSKLSWIEWLKMVPECALLEEQWGTVTFEEKHFVPLGMSMTNAYNYLWDGNIQAAQSISSLAKLLLLLSPLGAYRYSRPTTGETINVFGFLYDAANCKRTLLLNNRLTNSMRSDVKFSDALRDSFSKMKELEERRKEVAMLIEWDTDYKAKKTFLEYKPINADFVNYILHDKSSITSNIYPSKFREEVVRAALDNIDSKHIIIREIRRVMGEKVTKRFTFSICNALLMREYLLLLKEGKDMRTEKTVTNQMYNLGYKIAKELGRTRQKNEDGSYQASNEKKITAIAYRLLNEAKAGNRQLFFDTVARLHISAGMNIGPNFIKALDPNTSDKEFATIALAFTAGLIPSVKPIEESQLK